MRQGPVKKSLLILSVMLATASPVRSASLTPWLTPPAEEGSDVRGFEDAPVDSVGVLLGINSELRWEIDYLRAEHKETKSLLVSSEDNWYDTAWKSEPMRWIIFLVGIFAGAYASK